MSKFNRKKIAVTLAFASLFGSKTSAMLGSKSVPTSAVGGGELQTVNKQIRKSTSGVPIVAKCLLGFAGIVGIVITEEIVRRNIAKNESESKDKDYEASLKRKLGLVEDNSQLYREWEKLPPEFRNKLESGGYSHKTGTDVSTEYNKRLALAKQKKLKLNNEQRKLYLKQLETKKQQNCEKIVGCMGNEFLNKLTEFYNKGIQSFSTKVITSLVYQKDRFVQIDNKNLSNIWGNVFGFFCKDFLREISNIKKIDDNTLRINVPGLTLDDEKFMEIKLVESGLKLSQFTDCERVVVEFKLIKN